MFVQKSLETYWRHHVCKNKNWYLIAIIGWYLSIDLISRVFLKGPGDRGSIPARVIPKIKKMVLDAALFNTQHYKVSINGKVEQSRE